jgi:hypothetical protein
MKIVQFKDGRYGIRKLTIFGYRFLGKGTEKDYWWGVIKEFVPKYAAMSKEEVIDRWKRFPLKKKTEPEWCMGRVVKLDELR